MKQREIKFRAWGGKVMHHDVHEWGEGEWWRSFCVERMQEAIDRELCILMQYTGLKDASGREVYEGDIIDHGDDELAVVEWNPLQHRWTLYVYRDPVGNARCHLGEGMGDYEVVGSIYESPELITK